MRRRIGEILRKIFLEYFLRLGTATLGLVLNPMISVGGEAPLSDMIYIAPEESGRLGMDEKMHGFYIDQYEVTQGDYSKVMRSNPAFFKGKNRPVEKVTWNQAFAFCEKVGKRLPTEKEWEIAVRAGTTSDYFWGTNSPEQYAWFKGNADKQTHAVGKKEPNSWGLYDMAGNVWEWTQSDHEQGGKVVRGGSWRNGMGSLKSSHRIPSLPIHKFHYVGFRCALSKPVQK